MEEKITIGNIEVMLKCNGNTPRKYRETFGRDLMVDFSNFTRHLNRKAGTITGDADFSVVENMVYIMAKQYDETIGTIDEWLEQFGIDDIYQSMNKIFGVWEKSKQTTSTPKKNINK